MSEKITINGIYEKTLFRDEFSGSTMFSLAVSEGVKERSVYGNIVISGKIPKYQKGIPLSVRGTWDENPRGIRLLAEYIKEEAWDIVSAISFLSSGICGGIGYTTARNIVREFGVNIFEIAKNEDAPKKIASSINGLSEDRAKSLCSAINSTVLQRELFDLILHYKGSYSAAYKLFKLYGATGKKELLENPYEVGIKIGLSFQQCDQIAFEHKVDALNDNRINAAALTCTKSCASGGSVFSFEADILKKMNYLFQKSIYCNEIPSTIAVTGISNNKALSVEKGKLNKVFLKHLLIAEKNTAKQLERLAMTGTDLKYDDSLVEYAENLCGIKYAKQQKASFQVLKKTGVAIITGGPGTGKTTTINGIISAYEHMYPDNEVKLCAPTGRAAQRMTESTGREAVTIHRLLCYAPYGNDVTHKNANDPIEADMIVVDESSMLDIELASILLSAIKDGTLVLFVGDINQLPSVGPGDVLHDLIESKKITVCQLTDVFRQAGESPIVKNAIRLNNGISELETAEDFEVVYGENDEKVSEDVIKFVQKYYDREHPFDTQVLAPTHKGEAGVANLNQQLQKLINPVKKGENTIRYGRNVYHKGDKVIMLVNRYGTENGYFNGDIGIVQRIEDDNLIIKLGEKDITLTREYLDDVQLAYAMTIHKSQGSEFKNVIISLPYNPVCMLKRNLLYTAVTRAKKRIVICAEKGAISKSAKTCETGKRNTDLIKRIREMQLEDLEPLS